MEGSVRNGNPAITKIGSFDVDVVMEGARAGLGGV